MDFYTKLQKRELEKIGFIVGERDERLNTDYAGKYMVAESYEEHELPTNDGSNGPWCIVGDDLEKLIEQAHDIWVIYENEEPVRSW